MSTSASALKQYQTVAKAISYIRSHAKQQPTLADIANAVGMSEYHLQRLFAEWAGISPKRFLQYLTKEHAKQSLKQSTDVLSTSIESGLSSPGRLHDLMVSCEAMTPGQIKSRGQRINDIIWHYHNTFWTGTYWLDRTRHLHTGIL